MNTKVLRLRGIILLWVILFSFLPITNVNAVGDISTDTTWSGLIELTQDVRVTDEATLTISPGTIVRVTSGDGGNIGLDSELVEIIIEDGYLAADSAIFEASYSKGWFGISIIEDGDAEVLDSEINDSAAFGLYINTLNSVTISGNDIYSLHGKGGTAAFPNGLNISGIHILSGSHQISRNQIHNIQGGGGYPYSSGEGGYAYGISVLGGSSVIQSNTIHEIRGGNGGTGLQGTAGSNGGDGKNAGESGDPGTDGGDGGDGGNGSKGYGIFISSEVDGIQILNNEIHHINGGNGGSGGMGGSGGAGGNGADGIDGISAGAGGEGGRGGNGGNGGAAGDGGDAHGIYSLASNITFVENDINSIWGGNGHYGGQGGSGGNGGVGGDGGDSSGITSSGPGGRGGDGGDAGTSGSAGNGGNGVGFLQISGSVEDFSRNQIELIYGGDVWNVSGNGSGGDGGEGGDGGSGGSAGGVGGDGGIGGRGGTGVIGGNSGQAIGLRSNSTSYFGVLNSIIRGVQTLDGGDGAAGGTGGNGGSGGAGGASSVGEKALSGDDGIGGDGGDGGDGGNAFNGILVSMILTSARLTNNTFVYLSLGEGGAGGIAGEGGSGKISGADGTEGYIGANGWGYGVLAAGGSEVEIYNTILQAGYDSIQYGILVDDPVISSVTSDYNDVYFFPIPFSPVELEGLHDISKDPLFVSFSTGDLHLQTGSPCIDAGNNDAPGAPDDDFDGNPRPFDGDEDNLIVIDMGAYEFGSGSETYFLPLVMR